MSAAPSAPALSIVVPVYNEEGNVEPLHAELTDVAARLGRPYEILFVNDGSRDATLARLEALAARDPHLRIVDLAGNFGEAAALSAGFAHARGEIVVTLDGDGQNDPAAIAHLLARLGPDVDVVSGRRTARKEKFLTRVLPSRVANWLIALATGVPVYDCGCGLKAYRREIVAGAQLPRGMNRFLPAILGVDPARVAEVWVEDRPRGSGTSHYGLSRLFVVLRDLLALPLLVRRPPRGHAIGVALSGAQALLVAVTVAAVVGAVGFPADRAAALATAFAAIVAAGVGWAIRHNVNRWVAAQQRGVFRVRRVVG
ncbi:MAG TPA: glycosyltransferase family 2 protein [Candidatus Binatia bacterium]|jgi:glycosyltransferase involved in cell wall biosynthesis|nr:glycosyltransferase family 2 protein [Candidatus Binatia bacterium]